ncbi:hypothetical protein BDA96_04G287900 [Sorghum bicolor]|uniref:Uncharacterized protein n=2 Tax=Sorghum bicolor TaxID=4558 RepID=A0A921R788_SORBI|nr:hypothetical protein BDA96_04G287900 [Sorghum bicolor]OQU85561.1 hypothetical protein SORBI_3004G270350 [Sorghum bicolor]
MATPLLASEYTYQLRRCVICKTAPHRDDPGIHPGAHGEPQAPPHHTTALHCTKPPSAVPAASLHSVPSTARSTVPAAWRKCIMAVDWSRRKQADTDPCSRLVARRPCWLGEANPS